MSSDLPSTYALIRPVFSALHGLGGRATNSEIYSEVSKQLGLKDVVTFHAKDRNRDALAYRLAWARTHLKAHGLIRNLQPSVWELTAKGRSQHEVDPAVINQPPGGEKQVNMRLTPEALAMLEDICAHLGINKSVFIESAIRAFAKDGETANLKD